jgi:predicted dehydrogenase
MIGCALIGFGYWGPNLLRNLQQSPRFDVLAVVDQSSERLASLEGRYPGMALLTDVAEVLADPRIGAVVIATPVATHYALAHAALLAGKHVLVEKPMCATSAEGESLVEAADVAGRVLMVDHTFLMSSAVQAIRTLHVDGELGRISYYDVMRVNLGLFQPDVSVLWDLGAHDLSIMDFILDEEPIHVEAQGYAHVNRGVADIAFVTLHFASDVVAHFNLSWVSPVKMRRTAIGGDKKMLVWDDLNADERIKIYNSGITAQPDALRNFLLPQYRIGDVFSPRLDNREALAGVADHFADVIEGAAESVMDGRRGLRVVRTLERADESLRSSLALVDTIRADRA